MAGELRQVWICADGCGLHNRNMSGAAIPQPFGWEDGICLDCRTERVRVESGAEAADEFKKAILRGRPNPKPTPKPAPTPTPPPPQGQPAPEPPKPKRRGRKPRPALTPAVKDVVATRLREGLSAHDAAAELGVPARLVNEVRAERDIPSTNTIRSELREKAAILAILDCPELTDQDIGEEIDERPDYLHSVRRENQLPPAPKTSQVIALTAAQKEEATAMLKRGIAAMEVVNRLGCSKRSIFELRHELDLPSIGTIRADRRDERVAAAVAEHPDWTNDQIGEYIGEPGQAVGHTRRKLGLPRARQGVTEPLASRSKKKRERAGTINDLREAHPEWGTKRIAKVTGIPLISVRRIVAEIGVSPASA